MADSMEVNTEVTGMQQSDRVRPAYFFKRRCKVQKKMTWHLGTGLKGEPYQCFECLTGKGDNEQHPAR